VIYKQKNNPFRIRVKLYALSNYRAVQFLSREDLLEWAKAKNRSFKTILWGPENHEPQVVEVWEELKLYNAVKLAWKNNSTLSNSAPLILNSRGAILGEKMNIVE
jgi:hypothetical protein